MIDVTKRHIREWEILCVYARVRTFCVAQGSTMPFFGIDISVPFLICKQVVGRRVKIAPACLCMVSEKDIQEWRLSFAKISQECI
jgi:hypothetical protein